MVFTNCFLILEPLDSFCRHLSSFLSRKEEHSDTFVYTFTSDQMKCFFLFSLNSCRLYYHGPRFVDSVMQISSSLCLISKDMKNGNRNTKWPSSLDESRSLFSAGGLWRELLKVWSGQAFLICVGSRGQPLICLKEKSVEKDWVAAYAIACYFLLCWSNYGYRTRTQRLSFILDVGAVEGITWVRIFI